MTNSFSGVISPPGMRGTTEYVPLRWRLARNRSLVSCRPACSPSSTCPVASEARIEATTGLQMSQPRPLPYPAISWEKVLIPVARTTSNSSARDCSKCSHRALDCTTPHSSSSCLSMGTHEPQPVPAFVHDLTEATSVQPLSLMAQVICPLVTAWQEHTCASSGSARSTPPAGATRDPGSAGSGLPTSGRRVAYWLASPTSTPPSRTCASSETTSLRYEPETGSLCTTSSAPGEAACASPKLATSTPRSLSLVEVSAPGKTAPPPSSRSATTSAMA